MTALPARSVSKDCGWVLTARHSAAMLVPMPGKPIFDQATLAAVARERARLRPVLELVPGDSVHFTKPATIAGVNLPVGTELRVDRASEGTLDLRSTGHALRNVPVDALADCTFERLPAPEDKPF